jgi:hypothetical protein
MDVTLWRTKAGRPYYKLLLGGRSSDNVRASICEVRCSSPSLVKTILCQLFENFLILSAECRHAFLYFTVASFQTPFHA